ncbi:TPA: hypothetical protein DDW69_02575 [candidate division CPR2 bacterium]|uniref:Cell surface protein n=1 Tax=candidate division CPR2 bacterium GW2011_GWC1_41_48 TaxID=1618344 RepID=A0A0G0Z780_UNCC2|nr:MAG: Cell surface protein [candidate division CPR2 bacterium GW2011_GWC2_39_35]KKR28073.1 MAG: Cell surface protein [candidate division CPR2 bacterium GW2011_GWD2_39_7]KKR28904.1 MAG: Cell surface protein [candidate division CPR2 bacterium GW2011_GWD1_39_7]KKS08888.1 MAG: Cell surface protein [candidate division CPR2 bacterium GW2011_GWC1_41_48]OGB61731.1 MAG: hypothetical protein A2Y27_01305 [candidate division CPR2 bacterium GWD1_39_7]OGB72171.1 MAG: hypothetical protein A2Y26_00645 [cand
MVKSVFAKKITVYLAIFVFLFGNFGYSLANLLVVESRITTDSSDQTKPRISAGKIVYEDTRNGNTEIYMYNTGTSSETRITNTSANEYNPDIDGDKIVYSCDRGGTYSHIYVYDLSGSSETQVTTNLSDQTYPAIYGQKIVYVDNRNGNDDIYMYDLQASQETQISTDSSNQKNPVIYDQKIAYYDNRNGNDDVFTNNLAGSSETQITNNSANENYPHIYSDQLVYQKAPATGNYSVHKYDLTQSSNSQITSGSADPRYPRIYSDIIVYEDVRSGNSDVYAYQISKSLETIVVTGSQDQKIPAIYNGTAVWQDARNTHKDIYKATLTPYNPLTSMSDTLSVITPRTASTHTIQFTLGTTATIKQIDFQFEKAAGDATKPTNLNLSSSTLGTMTGLTNGSWTYSTSSAGSGLVKISGGGESKNLGDSITIPLNGVINPEIEDCTIAGFMYDTCNITIKTYSDAGSTLVDMGTVSYDIQDTASLTFKVEGVTSGTSTNGVTTTASTDYNLVPFGKLEIGSPEYAAQKLHVETTAANGYTVNIKMQAYMQGQYPANKIDPFTGSWDTPTTWSSPTGSTNSDSGWLGANTNDTRVAGWSSASAKFGPVSTTAHPVMYKDSKDLGSDAYVTYAIEVNQNQPSDQYVGTLIYAITPTY